MVSPGTQEPMQLNVLNIDGVCCSKLYGQSSSPYIQNDTIYIEVSVKEPENVNAVGPSKPKAARAANPGANTSTRASPDYRPNSGSTITLMWTKRWPQVTQTDLNSPDVTQTDLHLKGSKLTWTHLMWPKLTSSDPNWPKLISTSSDPNWHEFVSKDPKWPQVTQTDLKWPKLTWNHLKWPKLTWTQLKWPEVSWRCLEAWNIWDLNQWTQSTLFNYVTNQFNFPSILTPLQDPWKPQQIRSVNLITRRYTAIFHKLRFSPKNSNCSTPLSIGNNSHFKITSTSVHCVY